MKNSKYKNRIDIILKEAVGMLEEEKEFIESVKDLKEFTEHQKERINMLYVKA